MAPRALQIPSKSQLRLRCCLLRDNGCPDSGCRNSRLVVQWTDSGYRQGKTHIIEAEVNRRNLPHYDRKLRDTLIPLGLSLAVITTVGVLDVLFLTGTSASVLSAYAPHGLEAASAALHHPHAFATAFGHGFVFQGQQMFHVGGQHLALGMHQLQTAINANGIHHCFQFVADAVPVPAPDLGASGAVTGLKANLTSTLHLNAALDGSQHAMNAVNAELEMAIAACDGHAAALAGADVGMRAAETVEAHVAQFLIANTGLQDQWQKMTTTEDSEKSARKENADDETSPLYQPTNSTNSQEAINDLFSQALTGSICRYFVFTNSKGLPISQHCITPPASQKCQHYKEKGPAPWCRFCCSEIDSETRAYYHCCSCSSFVGSFDICEVCVAGRGCRCPERSEHVLFRKGLLSETADVGELEPIKPSWLVKRFKRSRKEAIDVNTGLKEGDEDDEEDMEWKDEELKPIQKAKRRWRFLKMKKSEAAEEWPESTSDLSELLLDDSDNESFFSLHPNELDLTLSDPRSSPLPKKEGPHSDRWSLRSWWDRDRRVCSTASYI